jgi:hypothetical protein
MTATVTAACETASARAHSTAAPNQTHDHAEAAPPRGTRTKRPAPSRPSRRATDDEILGIDSPVKPNALDPQLAFDCEPAHTGADTDAQDTAAVPAAALGAWETTAEPENLCAVFDANPDLRRAWHEAQAYRETFATPEEARAATALLADLDRMDALFFSRRPEDHAELARAIANLDPAAFASLARTMNAFATEAPSHGGNETRQQGSREAGNPGVSSAPRTSPVISNAPVQSGAEEPALPSHADDQQQIPRRPNNGFTRDDTVSAGLTPAQAEFFHATNAAAVQGVLDAIESQVERLLPEEIPKSARNRVVGEIYRELDATLRSNRQLAQQMRAAFRSGALDADHQRALVSLVTGRARQALPGVAKRVLNEWTSTVVAANQDRRSRQRAAERRVDIAGSGGAGNDGRRSMTPRDIDYARMSDADILNL